MPDVPHGGEDLTRYLSGDALVGDDYSPAEVEEWFAEEEEGYARLGSRDAASYRYGYHAWNRLAAYRHLPPGPFARVLGFGSADGEELLPVLSRTVELTIVEPSDAFARDSVHGKPATYVKPTVTGALPFPDGHFNLATCFGVLHHIPNVSDVVRELGRVLAPGGHLVVREPIVSMGDWTRPRPGLTRNERGIPLGILQEIAVTSGFVIERTTLCDFPLVPRLFGPFVRDVYNNSVVARIDFALAAIFSHRVKYHATRLFDRLRPASVFLVLRKA